MLVVHVRGGTNAGRKPGIREAKPWVCKCGRENRAYLATCFRRGCRERRPR